LIASSRTKAPPLGQYRPNYESVQPNKKFATIRNEH